MQQSFDLLILGSSSASPTTERNVSSQLLNIAERYFLIDCGEGTQMQLRRYKAKFQAIDHIFISHLHGDHFFGLPGLLSSMNLLGRKQLLSVYCPAELKGLINNINALGETRLNYEIRWIFTNNDRQRLLFEDNKVEVFSFPLKHRIFCTGFLFREKPLLRKIDKHLLEKYSISTAYIPLLRSGGDVPNEAGRLVSNANVTIDPPPSRSYAYCSDTIFDTTVADYARGVDLLYHESTFLNSHAERAKKTLHSTAAQAAEIARLAGAHKLLLGHFSARYRELADFEKRPPAFFQTVCWQPMVNP